ncbi:Vacuolar fusion protein mon1 [Ceratobasidium sp. 370]|nr:Vacuolar fusion protein mon1 [Ceratobasidium sp. 370]
MESNEGHRTPTRSRAPSRSRSHTPGPSPVAQHIQARLPTSSTNELTVHRESDVVVAVVPSEDHSPLEDERAAPVQLNEDVTLALRTQLRKTLNRMGSVPPTPSSGNLDTPIKDAPKFSPEPGEMVLPQDAVVQALETPQVDQYPPREYFILTHAGKPVFARCINAGRTRITFVLRAPLYYACVSSWGEPESVIRLHLDYLHLQILTALTGTQLQKIFERRGNFDLRRLLDGTDPLIHSLTARLSTDLSITLASLHTLRVDPGLRSRAAELVLPSKDTKDVLYVIVFSGDKVVTLVRPRKHSIHPSDLHLLLNTLSSPALRSSSSASWLPICLPKFNPKGFLYCYVSFLDSDDAVQNAEAGSSPGIGLAIITPDRDGFEKIRSLADGAEAALVKANLPKLLSQAAQSSPYSVAELGITGLLHFVYKSRTLVQVTHPQWDPTINQPRLVTLYQTIHDALHAKSGQQSGPVKLQLIKTDTECVMGWITQPFEIYVAVEPQLPKNAIVGAANAIARWVKKEEGKLFLRDAPVF